MLFKLSIALHNVEPNVLVLTTRSPTHRYRTHQRTLMRFYAEMSFVVVKNVILTVSDAILRIMEPESDAPIQNPRLVQGSKSSRT